MAAIFKTSASFPRLGVVTTNARDADVFGPAGHHLRWFVSGSVGFPADGFTIRRIDRALWERERSAIADKGDLAGASGWSSSLNWSGRDRHHQVHDAAVVVTPSDVTLKATSSGLQVASRGSGRHLLIHFNEPVLYVHLAIRRRRSRPRSRPRPDRPDRSAKPMVEVRQGALLIDRVALDDEVAIEHPGITDLLIPNTIESLTSLRFVRELAAAELAERRGTVLTHLDLPETSRQAYDLTQVDKGIRNRFFVGDRDRELRGRYPPRQVHELVTHLTSTVGQPGRTIHVDGGDDQAPADVTVLDHLRLATIDPNVARMLACYWVDPAPKAGLYVIHGDHDDRDKTISLGFAFSRHAARAPKLDRLSVEQLPGIDHRNRSPRGGAAVTGRRRPRTLRDTTRAVMLDVTRLGGSTSSWLTEKRPHVITTTTDRLYTDRDLPVPGSYAWELTPIDVFGRAGPPVATEPLSMVDLEHPVPPKHVVATLDQNGAPWTDPDQRDPVADRTGTVRATAEFGEAQHRVAPDATELRWCWRPGQEGAAERDPSHWSVLGTSTIDQPSELLLAWSDRARLTRYPLPVAEARVEDREARADRIARLDPVISRAVDAIEVGEPVVEVLLDVALLEPDLFAGHIADLDGQSVTVIGSTAGVAAGDDPTPDRRLTARLFLPVATATRAIERRQVLYVSHPIGSSWRPGLATPDEPDGPDIPPPLIELPLAEERVPKDRAEGGEVAIDIRFASSATGTLVLGNLDDRDGGDLVTIVGRVVADHRWTPAADLDRLAGRRRPTPRRSVLLRLRPDDADRLLQIERLGSSVVAAARHHRPYLLPRTSLGLDGSPGDIAVDLAPDDRFTTLWISAYTVDAGGKASTRVALPAELRAIRPPPADGEPASPYPEREGASAVSGQLSPPDVEGWSTVAVAWPTPDVGATTDAVRYELARALDATIVATDRDRWLRGGGLDEAIALGAVPGSSARLRVNGGYDVHPNGMVSVVVEAPSAASRSAVESIGAGRVRIGPPSTGTHFRLVGVTPVGTDPDEGRLRVLMRPPVPPGPDAAAIGGDPDGKTCTVEGAPDYGPVLADDDLVRQLADAAGTDPGSSNDQAFGLVTGVPVAGLRFVDRLAGRGRSRYFYKVRTVFPGEARSAWSPCSVAFHQVDASPADLPLDVVVGPDGRLVTFRLPDDPSVTGIRLVTRSDGGVIEEQDWAVAGSDPRTRLRPARLTARYGLVDLSSVLGTGAFAEPTSPPPVLGLYRADVDRAAPPPEANLLVPADGDPVPIARSVAVSRELDGVALALRLAGRGRGSADRWVDAVPGRYEIEIELDGRTDDPPEPDRPGSVAAPPPVERALITRKAIDIAGTNVDLDSPELPLPSSPGGA